MAKKGRDPITPKEWQMAVNAAHWALLIDSARQYGLIEGGAVFDIARCYELLECGRQMGVTPEVEIPEA